uniref:Zinc finger PHD-type domain-containing protein n=1 Tax=Anopheles stephensi TaxID=30069 RepID=A0A182YSK5_ANOST
MFEEMRVFMNQRVWNTDYKTLETCFKCHQASKGIMVKWEQCERKLHVTCIVDNETTLGSGWKCPECTTSTAPMKPNMFDIIVNRLTDVERKIEMQQNGTNQRGASKLPHPSSTVIDNAHFTSVGELTQSQVSARHVVSGKLPIFSGNPDEWDMFFSSFEESTRLCGYSDGENMQRLRECLRGHALKSVKRRLFYGNNLAEVIETLKTMYGRPELVIGTLLDNIRRMPAPKVEKLETLVDYGIEVEEICSTVRSSGVERAYDGPLLEELVERLPAVLRLNWDAHRDVLLRYVPVTLHAKGRQVNVIALLDEGSSVSLMEHALIKELGISGIPKPLCLSWTGGQHRDEAQSVEVSVNISGIRENDRRYEVPAIRTKDILTNRLLQKRVLDGWCLDDVTQMANDMLDANR